MPTPSVAVIDALNSLLEAEANSIFHFVGPGSPYLAQASPDVRGVLEELSGHLDQHQQELAKLIQSLGGVPSIPPLPDPEDQYLSFLSLKFLLPKLIESKVLMIQQHASALQSVQADPKVVRVLETHLTEMNHDLATLRKITAEAADGKST